MSGDEQSTQPAADGDAEDLELDPAAAEAVRGGASGGDDPTESVSLNFGHITHEA